MDPKIADVRCAKIDFGHHLTESGLAYCRSSLPERIADYRLASLLSCTSIRPLRTEYSRDCHPRRTWIKRGTEFITIVAH